MELIIGHLDESPVEHLEDLDQIADRTGATIQAFDARYVVSVKHLRRAVELADRAIERDEQIADDRGVEILLYAAGRRQIDRALEMGLKSEPHPVAIVIDGGDEATARTEVRNLMEGSVEPDEAFCSEDRIRTYFDITDAEIDTGADLESLVLERVALLTIDK